jgi:hypothetical protein
MRTSVPRALFEHARRCRRHIPFDNDAEHAHVTHVTRHEIVTVQHRGYRGRRNAGRYAAARSPPLQSELPFADRMHQFDAGGS